MVAGELWLVSNIPFTLAWHEEFEDGNDGMLQNYQLEWCVFVFLFWK